VSTGASAANPGAGGVASCPRPVREFIFGTTRLAVSNHRGPLYQHLEGPAADGFVVGAAPGRRASGIFALPASVDRSFGRLIRALVRALSGWSDVPEPGREVQA
jgi:hypothetical protein